MWKQLKKEKEKGWEMEMKRNQKERKMKENGRNGKGEKKRKGNGWISSEKEWNRGNEKKGW